MEQLLTEAQAAEQLQVSRSFLKGRRSKGGGPKFVKVGHTTVRYRQQDLDEWVEGQVKE